MNDIVLPFVAAMGVPSAITGLLVWQLKKQMDKRDREKAIREENVEKLMLLIMQTSRANNVLATATAKAVQRIPDAHCNGDMEEALSQAAKIQGEEKAFLFDQGVRNIFRD